MTIDFVLLQIKVYFALFINLILRAKIDPLRISAY